MSASSSPISIALVGIGGYGNNFVKLLLDAPNQSDFRIAGAIDPWPASCRRLGELNARGVPVFPTLDAFQEADRADLTIVCSPLQHHSQQTCQALAKGSHVLCEKPLCVTIDQARRMRETRDRAGKIVGIGYQWSFSDAVQKLKADVMAGALGKAKRLKSLVLWPRDEAYYARNQWAGAKSDPHGNFVLDSPVNNACAHYLHNMLYVLGPRVDRSAEPATVTAELYRAHEIQNYDTAALRCMTRDGIEILFFTSHCTAENRGPVFTYEFEKATVTIPEGNEARITARFNDGTTRDYGTPSAGREKLWQTMDCIRTGAPIVCGIEAAFAHTQCVQAAQQSTPEIVDFPASVVHHVGLPGHRMTVVDNLSHTLTRCYEEGKLPSELDIPWAKQSTTIHIGPELSL
jgi:predicted dehydrogenase